MLNPAVPSLRDTPSSRVSSLAATATLSPKLSHRHQSTLQPTTAITSPTRTTRTTSPRTTAELRTQDAPFRSLPSCSRSHSHSYSHFISQSSSPQSLCHSILFAYCSPYARYIPPRPNRLPRVRSALRFRHTKHSTERSHVSNLTLGALLCILKTFV